MVASLVFPAYADERGRPDITNPQQIALSQSDAPVVHQNGNPDFENSAFIDDTFIADDFVLSSGFTITDAHFVSQLNNDDDVLIEPLFYFIFADNGGQPGAEIASGTATNVQIMDIDPDNPEDGIVEIWFDFEDGEFHKQTGDKTFNTIIINNILISASEPSSSDITILNANPDLIA